MATSPLSPHVYVGDAKPFIEDVNVIERFKIENVAEAEAFLRDLLAKDEYRSVDEVIVRARKLVPDENLRMYFINKGKQILEALAV